MLCSHVDSHSWPVTPGIPPTDRTVSVRFIRDLSDTTRELWQSRFLLQQLVRRNIRIRYEQAIMGFAWAILRREQ